MDFRQLSAVSGGAPEKRAAPEARWWPGYGDRLASRVPWSGLGRSAWGGRRSLGHPPREAGGGSVPGSAPSCRPRARQSLNDAQARVRRIPRRCPAKAGAPARVGIPRIPHSPGRSRITTLDRSIQQDLWSSRRDQVGSPSRRWRMRYTMSSRRRSRSTLTWTGRSPRCWRSTPSLLARSPHVVAPGARRRHVVDHRLRGPRGRGSCDRSPGVLFGDGAGAAVT